MKCPVCGKEAVIVCKCPRRDSVCPEGHEWHKCVVHDKVVMGQSDHSGPTNTCACEQDN